MPISKGFAMTCAFTNPVIQRRASNKANVRKMRQAREFYSPLMPLILSFRQQEMSMQEIADTLNKMNVKTQNGRLWHPVQVFRVMKKYSS